MTKQDWEHDVDNHISHIADELVHGRIGFLFGAGMSIQSGGIPGKELGFQLILRSLYKYKADKGKLEPELEQQIYAVASKYPPEAIASGIESEFPFKSGQLTSILKDVVFDGKEPQPHSGHTCLASIMARFAPVKLLFTTNWDNLIEDELGNRAVSITHNNRLFEMEEILSDKIGVVHLHGTFEQDPLIKETDIMSTDRPLFSLFLAELMTKSFVFIGYSLSDPNMRSLYFKVNDILTKQRKDFGKLTYVVFPAKNDVDRSVSAATWKARNAKYIPLAADAFFKQLYEALQTKAITNFKEELRTRLDWTRDELDAKIDNLQSLFPDFGSPEQVLIYLDRMTRGGSE